MSDRRAVSSAEVLDTILLRTSSLIAGVFCQELEERYAARLKHIKDLEKAGGLKQQRDRISAGVRSGALTPWRLNPEAPFPDPEHGEPGHELPAEEGAARECQITIALAGAADLAAPEMYVRFSDRPEEFDPHLESLLERPHELGREQLLRQLRDRRIGLMADAMDVDLFSGAGEWASGASCMFFFGRDGDRSWGPQVVPVEAGASRVIIARS